MQHDMANIIFNSPLFSSSQSLDPSSNTIRCTMKDVPPSRHSRNSLVYPKKRPSPHGVSKSHKQSPLIPYNGVTKKSPRAAKMAQVQQRQREAQMQAMRRDGIFIEEEYREEICYYMQQMEVRWKHPVLNAHLFIHIKSNIPCLLPSQWTSNRRLGGI